jgi:hypothetical protein
MASALFLVLKLTSLKLRPNLHLLLGHSVEQPQTSLFPCPSRLSRGLDVDPLGSALGCLDAWE